MTVAGITYDVALDGYGYMLQPGGKPGAVSYRRFGKPGQLGMRSVNVTDTERLDGAVPGKQVAPFRRLFWGNWRGAGQPFISEGSGRDSWAASERQGLGNDLVGLRPVLGGSALALAAQGVSAQVDTAALSVANFQTVTVGGITVVTVDTKCFVSSNPGTNNSGFVLRATAGATVQAMTVWQGQILMSVGGTLYLFNLSTGAFTAFGSGLAGVTQLYSYQGVLMAAVDAALYWLIPAVGAWSAGVTLDSGVTAFEELEGILYIGANTMLYRLEGSLKPKAPSSAPATLDYFDYRLSVIWRTGAYYRGFWTENNFGQMKGWRGSLWFFAGGQLLRARPVGGGLQAHLEIEAQPIYGLPLGLGVGGGLLAVAVRPGSSEPSRLWINDGSLEDKTGAGWWKLAEGGYQMLPFGNAGYSQGTLNVVDYGTSGSLNFVRYLLDTSSPLGFKADNFGVARSVVTGKLTLPMVMPEDLANNGGLSSKVLAVKLLRVGVEWATWEVGTYWPTIDVSNTTACEIRMELSIDGGTSWTYLVQPVTLNSGYAPGTPDFRGSRFELPVASPQADAMYPASPGYNGSPVADPGWLVRISWKGTIMPLLRRVWLDYQPVEVLPDSGLGWELDLNLTEPVVGLDGARDDEAALTKLDRLWNLWRNAHLVYFGDLDGVNTYKVRVVGLETRRVAQGAMPNLAQGWVARVRLVEVFE